MHLGKLPGGTARNQDFEVVVAMAGVVSHQSSSLHWRLSLCGSNVFAFKFLPWSLVQGRLRKFELRFFGAMKDERSWIVVEWQLA